MSGLSTRAVGSGVGPVIARPPASDALGAGPEPGRLGGKKNYLNARAREPRRVVENGYSTRPDRASPESKGGNAASTDVGGWLPRGLKPTPLDL